MAYERQIMDQEAARCILCTEEPCSSACLSKVPAGRIIRALRFRNEDGAYGLLMKNEACLLCSSQSCRAACLRGKIGHSVDIPAVMRCLAAAGKDEAEGQETEKEEKSRAAGKVDLSVDFCGIRCENPFFLSSSVVCSNEEMISRAFEAGWAGVAYKTIGSFVPEEVSPRFSAYGGNGGMTGLKNIEQISDHMPEENFSFIRNLKKKYPSKIIIASIMGRNAEEWEELARGAEEAGADMVECNFSCPHMSGTGLGSDTGTNPELVAACTKAVRKGTRLPVMAKMTPNITNMELPAKAAVSHGADALAAINTVKSIMNIDLNSFISGPDISGKSMVGGYSGRAVRPIALRFIHDLKSCGELKDIPVSGMGGVENWRDAAEFIAMGCGTVQVTTAVMEYGYRIIDDLIDGLKRYMASNGYQRISDFKGRALKNLLPAEELDRHTICYPRFIRQNCIGCGRCVLSCMDGGHQALRMGREGRPLMNPYSCVGCHLCRLVCPAGAIESGTRTEKKVK